METTTYIVTTVETQYPSVTETATNAIDIFFYDVAQANQNQATWWNSVSHFCNNIIDAVKSCGSYISYIIDVSDVIISENAMPIFIGTAVTIGITFMVLDFYRKR